MQDIAYELNFEGARLVRAAALTAENEDKRKRFVAGAIGPTNRTASISPDVSNPGFRAITFDQLREAYAEQVRGLLDGGADLLLIETIFDTLNAKAAIHAILDETEARGVAVPVMISGTITDLSGRLLSGQTPAAFWNSIRHAAPFSVGLNCALGAKEMRAHIAELGRVADTLVCAYPNAGLPNEFGLYDESPEYMAELLGEFAASGLVNIVGGCCGTTPAHIRAIAEAVKDKPPRQVPAIEPRLRLSGLESFTLTNEIPFVNVGERTNVTGSAKFRKLITAGDYNAALAIARDQVENGAQVIDVNMDEGLLESEQAMVTFLNLIASEPDIARVPVMIDSSKFRIIEAGLKCVQGKAVVNSISMKEGEEEFIKHAKVVRRHGAAVVVMAFDEKGQADTFAAQDRDLRARLQDFDGAMRLPARRHHLRSEHLCDRDRHRGAQQLRRRLHRSRALDQGEPARRAHLGRRVEPLVRVPRQRAGARGDALRVPLSRDQSRHGHGHRQCRPDGGVRRSRSGAARSLRGCRAQPPRGCGRAPARPCAALHRQGQGGEGSRSRLARMAGRQAALPRAGPRHHRLHRRRHRGSAQALDTCARRDRRPADGRHERGRRPVRLGQDVPAASGEVRARDEAGGRVPPARSWRKRRRRAAPPSRGRPARS